MSEVIKVGMADLKTCRGDDGVTTLGLGSCVGIAIEIRQPVLAGWLILCCQTVRKLKIIPTGLSLQILALRIW